MITESQCQRCGACCSLLIDGELIACRHLTVADGTYQQIELEHLRQPWWRRLLRKAA